MLALFCLRLALGMLACLLILPARLVHPRYYRTHFLTALGLTCLAWLSVDSSVPLRDCIILAILLCFAGAVLWSVDGAPGGRSLIWLSVVILAGSIFVVETKLGFDWSIAESRKEVIVSQMIGDLASAAVLGTAMSAMLMGHSYLIAPGMSLSPLMRLLAALVVALVVRMVVDGIAGWYWSTQYSLSSLRNDTLLWLPVRWLVGFALPLGLTWMAWQSARIRSTQSATGILYVVVIFCFLGELTALLLRDTTGLTM